MLPFTREVYFRLFEHYNAAIWPAQIVAYGLGLLLILLVLKPRRGGDRAIAVILAASWVWMGVVFHVMYFATINWAAWAFGAFFVVEGLLFAWTGALRGRLQFRFAANAFAWIALGLAAFSMAVYPFIGSLTDHGWPRAPMFGVAPAPTTLFTLGMLLLTRGRTLLHLLLIPVLWCFVAGAAALPLYIPEGLVLPLASICALFLAFWKNLKSLEDVG